MSTDHALGLQNISRIVEALEISDEKDFDQFCLQELKTVTDLIDHNTEYVSLDTVLFQAYILLDYRIEKTEHSLSDRLIESIFSFINHFVKPYSSCYESNLNSCLQRALSL